MSAHPYASAPRRSFWSRAVSHSFDAADLLPEDAILLRRRDRVMSAGSCFAANLVPYLRKSGFEYVRTEVRPAAFRALPPENLGYDSFSAAYGNIYTTAQLRQLIDRIKGWTPLERYWKDNGEFVDPFRPGLRYRARSVDEFDALTQHHLRCVRMAFEQATAMVFTLGLTEAWRSREDGAVYPACPGTVAGEFDPERHEFWNMSASETADEARRFIVGAREINPALRIILTVSPVPLVATASSEHVLSATIYSKSVLRVAAEELARTVSDVIYFPAYEIVTGPQAPWEAFEPDRRNVAPSIVEAVMTAFLAHCETDAPKKQENAAETAASAFLGQVVRAECEEMMADAAILVAQTPKQGP